MFKALLNVLLGAVTSIINVVLLPINLLVENLFPDLSSSITNFNTLIVNTIGGFISWFSNLLPPLTKNVIITYLTFMVSYYTFVFAYTGIQKVWVLIQKLKFW